MSIIRYNIAKQRITNVTHIGTLYDTVPVKFTLLLTVPALP
jgi:hypothetical protein